MKRCDSLPHSMTIACFSWLIVYTDRVAQKNEPQAACRVGTVGNAEK